MPPATPDIAHCTGLELMLTLCDSPSPKGEEQLFGVAVGCLTV